MWKFLVIALVGQLVMASPRPEGQAELLPTPPPPDCAENEVYKACTSSSCSEATCHHPQVGPACTADCIRGCFCKHRFYRDEQRNCVAKDLCPEGSAARTYVEEEHAHE
ncbi:cysteine-rich venom protein 6 [Ixodes scapularis]|uniref:cysteine-rich venom protein 6 n=1 Tax=Ixodes scapularis TaxID=6945 RepID=UPI001C38D203|nr:cysteine-rich venom protein 6 [Ixodes scapularis]